jgi:hypothetical protein
VSTRENKTLVNLAFGVFAFAMSLFGIYKGIRQVYPEACFWLLLAIWTKPEREDD